MSRFLLRCTITAACAVSLASAAPALAQSDSAARADIGRAMPTIMAPAAFASPTNVTAMLAPASVASSTDRIDAPRPINEDASSVVRRRAAFSRPAVLMITGGALLLTGLLVDGDASSILIIAGAGIGGYGLYLHLQSPNARLRR